MPITEIAVLGSWFLIYILLRLTNVYFGMVWVFITFLFAFIVSNKEFSSFYLLLYLIAVAIDLAITQIHTTSDVKTQANVGKAKASGVHFVAISLLAGLVMYFMISLISRQVGGNIVGVPNLAITTPSAIANTFKPVFEGTLGVVENTFAFVLFDVSVLLFGALFTIVLGIIISLFLVGLIMGLFHVVAYDVAFGLLLYGTLAFILFILSKYLFKDSLSADTAHYLNNGVISVNRSLAVVIP